MSKPVEGKGTAHGPWHLRWEEHDRRHQQGPWWDRNYVLSPMGWPDELWCQTCQEGVLR